MPNADRAAVTDADFYLIERSLEPEGRQVLRQVREFMEKSVQPVINHYRTREEFPFDLLPGLRKLGIAGQAYSGLENHVGRFVADSEAIYSYEGTREINTLIVGRAITGLSAFV
jgi:alkylation response protein AidB-like acyl-CoA dehydrogenase